MNSARDAAKLYFPSATEDELYDILMCCTAYPCCSFDYMVAQLQEYQVKASSPSHAIHLAHQEMDMMFDEYSKKQKLNGVSD